MPFSTEDILEDLAEVQGYGHRRTFIKADDGYLFFHRKCKDRRLSDLTPEEKTARRYKQKIEAMRRFRAKVKASRPPKVKRETKRVQAKRSAEARKAYYARLKADRKRYAQHLAKRRKYERELRRATAKATPKPKPPPLNPVQRAEKRRLALRKRFAELRKARENAPKTP